jgi:hypothetical protein
LRLKFYLCAFARKNHVSRKGAKRGRSGKEENKGMKEETRRRGEKKRAAMLAVLFSPRRPLAASLFIPHPLKSLASLAMFLYDGQALTSNVCSLAR